MLQQQNWVVVKKLHSLQSLENLLSVPLQKKFINPQTRNIILSSTIRYLKSDDSKGGREGAEWWKTIIKNALNTVMVNFMCQLNWTEEGPDSW